VNGSEKTGGSDMDSGEKVYRTMGAAGVMSLVAGIVIIAVAAAVGVMGIVSGSMLLSDRKKVLF